MFTRQQGCRLVSCSLTKPNVMQVKTDTDTHISHAEHEKRTAEEENHVLFESLPFVDSATTSDRCCLGNLIADTLNLSSSDQPASQPDTDTGSDVEDTKNSTDVIHTPARLCWGQPAQSATASFKNCCTYVKFVANVICVLGF